MIGPGTATMWPYEQCHGHWQQMRQEGEKKVILWAGVVCFLQRYPHCEGEGSRSGYAAIIPVTLPVRPTVPPAALESVATPFRGACLAHDEGPDTTRRYPSPAWQPNGGYCVTL